MKIVVDEVGWNVVEEGPLPSAPQGNADGRASKPSSGVFLKMAPVEVEGVSFTDAPTEPSPPSSEAMAHGAIPLPTPPLVPEDLKLCAPVPRRRGG